MDKDKTKKPKKGSFVKGQKKNPKSGRAKGTQNQQTKDIKELITYVIEYLDTTKIDKMLKKLLKDKPEVVLNFLGKISPKDLNITGQINVNPLANELKMIREKRYMDSEANIIDVQSSIVPNKTLELNSNIGINNINIIENEIEKESNNNG